MLQQFFLRLAERIEKFVSWSSEKSQFSSIGHFKLSWDSSVNCRKSYGNSSSGRSEKSQNFSIGHFDSLANLVISSCDWLTKLIMFLKCPIKKKHVYLLRWIDEFWYVFPAIDQQISQFSFLWAIDKFLDFVLPRKIKQFHIHPPPWQNSLISKA